jgi:glycosyltransferase involved in cell wall biosynthesis
MSRPPRDAAPDGAVRAHVLDIDLSAPVPELRRIAADGRYAERALVLVRLYGEPLGLCDLAIPQAGLSGETVTERLVDRSLPRMRQASDVADVAGVADAADAVDGPVGPVLRAIRAAGGSAFSKSHDEFIGRAPRCSVVVCTRDRPDDLLRCLASLAGQDHPDFAVWVVDNSAGCDLTRKATASFSADLDIRYVVEPRPGLSRARNAALRQDLAGDIVAWIDDDEVADPIWLTELVRAFDGRPEIAAASGLVAPAELHTAAQVWYEQFGGHSKGRGCAPDTFSPATWGRQHPLYPLPPFGVGANMAFRISALRELGGFDEALGAGTPAQGGEDTKAITDLLLAGRSTAYWPSAITRHFHRRDLNGLRRQMIGYGTGLTAFYTAAVLSRPATLIDLVRLTPRALHDLYSPDSARVATVEDDFPRELLAANRRGMAAGPWLYLRGRFRNWRTDRRPAEGR